MKKESACVGRREVIAPLLPRIDRPLRHIGDAVLAIGDSEPVPMDRCVFGGPRQIVLEPRLEALAEFHADDRKKRAFLKRPQWQRLAVETRQRCRPFSDVESDTLGASRGREGDHFACARRETGQCKRRRGATGEHRGAGQKLSTCQHKGGSTTVRLTTPPRLHSNAWITSPSRPDPAYRDCPSLRQ